MKRANAEITAEYGPYPGVDGVHGVTCDGEHVWFASGTRLNACDPAGGNVLRSIDIAAHAGTAFDGRHLFQIVEDGICKIDPATGQYIYALPTRNGNYNPPQFVKEDANAQSRWSVLVTLRYTF